MFADCGEDMTGALSIGSGENVDRELSLLDIGRFELIGDKLEGWVIFHGTGVVRETASQRDLADLWSEQISLVEKQDDS